MLYNICYLRSNWRLYNQRGSCNVAICLLCNKKLCYIAHPNLQDGNKKSKQWKRWGELSCVQAGLWYQNLFWGSATSCQCELTALSAVAIGSPPWLGHHTVTYPGLAGWTKLFTTHFKLNLIFTIPVVGILKNLEVIQDNHFKWL